MKYFAITFGLLLWLKTAVSRKVRRSSPLKIVLIVIYSSQKRVNNAHRLDCVVTVWRSKTARFLNVLLVLHIKKIYKNFRTGLVRARLMEI